MSKSHRVALMGGDGVGPEVVDGARQVLEALQEALPELKFEFTSYSVGYSAYKEKGEPLPEEALEGIRNSDAVLMGAMSTGLVPPPSPMGTLRKTFDLYADVRPIKSFPGVWCLKDDMDLVVVRENTSGFLADRNLYKGYGEFMPDEDTVLSLRVLTRYKCERIARFAFQYAKEQGRKKITVAHKANVLRYGCGFFLEICREVSKEFPEIEMNDCYIDTVANDLIAHPDDYDIILTTNMFGDIVSDEAAALVSSLVPTANFGKECAMFRPIHEAKLEIAGQDKVNPLSTILSAGMMLNWLKEFEAARRLEEAVAKVLGSGRYLPIDLGGSTSTSKMVQAICEQIKG